MAISKKRLAEIEAISDKNIDTSDITEKDRAFFETAKLIMPSGKEKVSISLRIDADVLKWFKSRGEGHLTRMNAVLRAYMLANYHE